MRFTLNIFKASIISVLFICCISSCKKFIEVEAPNNSITEGSIFQNDLTSIAALTGIYSNISNRGLSGNVLTFSKLGGLSSDELDLWSGASDLEKAYYQNDLQASPLIAGGANSGAEMWNVAYRFIYECNQAIQGISDSKALTSDVKKQLLGEAGFLRAYLYFYLVNLYGDLPIVTNTYYEENRHLARSPVTDVYNLIISDLKEASGLLSDTYLNSVLKPYSSNVERVRPTKWAAKALLSRVYLYSGDYANAEIEASSVISQTSLFDISGVPLNNVFLKNSKEAIWQLQPVINGWNTVDARWFVLSSSPTGFSTTKSVYLSASLLNAFENGDNRKTTWVGRYNSTNPAGTYSFPNKYKDATQNASITSADQITEYQMILRLAEQYLNRAEARARMGNVSGAVADLNVIRTRARDIPSMAVPNPLPNLSSSLTQQQAIDAVLKERRIELFTEHGHRWLDLKRTGLVNETMNIITPLKGGSWKATDQFYPISAEDIFRNSNLEQNSGY